MAGYFAGATPPSTVFILAQAVTLNANQRIWSVTKSSVDGNSFHEIAQGWEFDRRSSAGVFKSLLATVANPATGVPFISACWFDGTTGKYYLNNNGVNNVNLSGTTGAMDQFDLGLIRNGSSDINGAGASNWFDGYIAEVIVFNVALSEANVQNVMNYLANKYAISGYTLNRSAVV